MRLRRRSLLLAALLLLLTPPAPESNDPGFKEQWHLHLIGAETAWPTGTGLGLTVAVVDTGVDLAHPDLKDKLLPGRNFVTDGADAMDDNGHGTHVAGIAAAMTNNARGVAGVAADARILPVKVLKADGTGTVDDVADGIEWAADNGASVVNVSIGVERDEGDDEPLLPALVPIADPAILSAVRYAWNKGVICVLAAGNDPNQVSAYDEEEALVVGATDRHDSLAEYSSTIGKAKWGLVAPGGSGPGAPENNVLSTYWHTGTSTYAWAAGTSMAAPHVAGAVAILRGLGLNRDQTVSRVLSTAKDLGAAGEDDTFGHGRLDVAKAVSGMTPVATKSATGAPPSTPTTQLRTTPTTRARVVSKAGVTTTTTTTTEAARRGGSSSEGSPAPVDVIQPGEVRADDDDGEGDAEAAGAPDQDGGDKKGLPVAPPLLATVLLAATTARLLRTRRV